MMRLIERWNQLCEDGELKNAMESCSTLSHIHILITKRQFDDLQNQKQWQVMLPLVPMSDARRVSSTLELDGTSSRPGSCLQHLEERKAQFAEVVG